MGRSISKSKIKELRGDMTQEAFGHLIGVHWVTISRWETGVYRPEGLTLKVLKLLQKHPRKMSSMLKEV